MVKNGPFALFFHTLIVIFMLAPMVVVCTVAFTPENTLTMPWAAECGLVAALVHGRVRA